MEARRQTVYYNVTLRLVRATIVAEEKRVCVCVCVCIQHGMRMNHIVIHVLCGCTTLFNIISQAARHSKKYLLNMKYVF